LQPIRLKGISAEIESYAITPTGPAGY